MRLHPTTARSSSWTRDKLGDIFGLTLDDSGNIYVAATTAYGSDIYPTGGNAMDIYKIDGGTGAITLFKTLPQSPATFPGAGLGNIAYDCAHKNFYVSNLDDGLIYRLDLSGNTLSTWDHGLHLPTANPPSAAILDTPTTAFTPLGRRVWGLQEHNNRLYYAVWWEDLGRPDPVHANEVWSIALSSSGDFVLGTDQLEISLPVDVFQDRTVSNYSNPVSDISFGPTGTMLLGERTMHDDTTPNAHESRALEYMLSGIVWIPTTHIFSLESLAFLAQDLPYRPGKFCGWSRLRFRGGRACLGHRRCIALCSESRLYLRTSGTACERGQYVRTAS